MKINEHSVEIDLQTALMKCGVPKDAIVIGYSIRYRNRSVVYPDIFIVGTDHKTVMALFEIKVNNTTKESKYERALHFYHEIVERYPCYIVSLEANGELLAARLSISQKENDWVDISDANRFVKLIGRYNVESAVAIESKLTETVTVKQEELGLVRWIIGGIGLVLTIVFAWMEWYHHEFSWKVYSVFFATLVLFVSVSGYSIYLKSGEHEIRIGREFSKQAKVDA